MAGLPHFPDVDTAYVYIAGRAGGPILFHLINATLLVATIGSGMGAQLGAARLLYGMGSQGAIPRFFTHVAPANVDSRAKRAAVRSGSAGRRVGMNYQLGAELLNFGAFLAFAGVNFASFWHFWVRRNDRTWSQAVLPLLGFVVCLYLWVSLRWQAKAAGFAWVAMGVVYLIARMASRRAIRSSVEGCVENSRIMPRRKRIHDKHVRGSRDSSIGTCATPLSSLRSALINPSGEPVYLADASSASNSRVREIAIWISTGRERRQDQHQQAGPRRCRVHRHRLRAAQTRTPCEQET